MKRKRTIGYIAFAALVVAKLLLPLAASAYAQAKPEQATEADLKVAYTIAFLKFLSHPDGDERLEDPTIHMCVIGSGSVMKAFARANGTSISMNEVKKLQVTSSATRLTCPIRKRCWAVYIEHANRHRTAEIAEELRGTGVLVITESKGALKKGSMVNLLRVGDRLRWEMSRSCIEAEDLVMSSQVYRNAVKVE